MASSTWFCCPPMTSRENENYLSVEDEGVLNAVYNIFKEKYKDVLTFEE